jgi:hypothetical protein
LTPERLGLTEHALALPSLSPLHLIARRLRRRMSRRATRSHGVVQPIVVYVET